LHDVKLKRMPARLNAPPPRLGYVPGDRAAQDKSRDEWAPWRGWYKTARWRRLAAQCFMRDGYVCQKTGALLVHKAPHPLSPVAHHIKRHRGDEALFWDATNIITVSKEWHDREEQRAERAADLRGSCPEVGGVSKSLAKPRAADRRITHAEVLIP
jgi:5-methylcytosine-specific restriction endonuclease McrA